MSTARSELKEALWCYTTDTLVFISTINGFCERVSKWILGRETELNMMKDIKVRLDGLNLDLSHVTGSQEKGKAFMKYARSKVNLNAAKRRAELQEELAAVLKATVWELMELQWFVDAVEKLAVTSLQVFMENQVLHLPEGIDLQHVQVVIMAARVICPQLLEFQRDAGVFFQPKLQNVEVLSYQLDRYIQTTQIICDKMEKSCLSEFSLKTIGEDLVDLESDESLTEDHMQRMLDHINQLQEIRKDRSFRMVFLFQEDSGSSFCQEFSERQPRMLDFLEQLEQTAVQLDNMNKGARISSVAGSSVGAVGGVLSIVGLVLIPFTAGVSLALTMAGVGLGITSGVNSLVTTATEVGVNRKHQNKANETLQTFVENVQVLQDCLEEASTSQKQMEMVLGIGRVLVKAGGLGKSINSFADAANAAKLLKTKEVIAGASKAAVQEGKAGARLASDVPDIGQAAMKGPLALSQSARAGFIVLNGLFLGMDIFFICRDSYSLSKGSETELSQFIRARSSLWSSEMDSWQKIHEALKDGQAKSEELKAELGRTFYPVKDGDGEEEEEENTGEEETGCVIQ